MANLKEIRARHFADRFVVRQFHVAICFTGAFVKSLRFVHYFGAVPAPQSLDVIHTKQTFVAPGQLRLFLEQIEFLHPPVKKLSQPQASLSLDFPVWALFQNRAKKRRALLTESRAHPFARLSKSVALEMV